MLELDKVFLPFNIWAIFRGTFVQRPRGVGAPMVRRLYVLYVVVIWRRR